MSEIVEVEGTYPVEVKGDHETGGLSMKAQAVLFIFARIIPNTSVRMIYPFLSVFAVGLGVGLPAMSLAVSSRSFLGMANPFLGSWVDRSGRKAGMRLGLLLLIISSVLVILFPGFPAFVVFLCLSYIGFLVMAMSIQSFLGDEVAYAQRGRIISFVETSWALSLIISMPLISILLDRWGWRAPFPLLAGLALVMFYVIHKYLPDTRTAVSSTSMGVFGKLKKIARKPEARLALLGAIAFSTANECIGLIFGVWISDSLGAWDEISILPLMALGLASVVIGVAELSGELLGGGVIDRLGKERSILLGIICHAVAALLLPILGNHGLWGAYFGLFMLYLSFEFIMVASITLMSEMLPAVRSTMIGTFLASTACGRMLGALLVPVLYQTGFRMNAMAAFFISLVALFFMNRLRVMMKQSLAAGSIYKDAS